jgi:hypothetical protein
MSNIPAHSPGCFGSALAFESTAPVCTVCKFASECKPLHLENLEALRVALGVTTKVKAVAKKAEVQGEGLTMPVKTQALIDKLNDGDFKITESLRAGKNPFEGVGMAFMRVVAHLLLRAQAPIARDHIAFALATTMKWQSTTADSHARMAMQALEHIGAVESVNGAIILRRN